jgi:hypothetical protein
MSTAQLAIKTDTQSRVSDAIHRAQAYLLAQQNLEGYWWAELEANVTLTAEYVMLHRILIAADPRARFSNGKDREEQIRQMARYILREQRPHGGWELFYGDGGEISTTIEAYFALKLAGHSAGDPAMRRGARLHPRTRRVDQCPRLYEAAPGALRRLPVGRLTDVAALVHVPAYMVSAEHLYDGELGAVFDRAVAGRDR